MDRQSQEMVEGLVRDFSQRSILINLLYIGLSGAVLYSAYTLSDPMRYLPMFLILIMVGGLVRGFARQFLYVPINATLYQDCNPEVYHGAYLALEKMERQPFYHRVCVLGIANGIYYMGDHEGAIAYLKNNLSPAACNFSQWLSYQNTLANCYACRPDLEALRGVQQELVAAEKAPRLRRGERDGLAACLQIVDIYVTLFSGDYEAAKVKCQERLATSGLLFQKIGLRYRLGYIAVAQGDEAGAREHLGYVIQNGGGLCFVPKARYFLQKLGHRGPAA